MILAEHNNAFCDVELYGDEQILMEQLINIIKALTQYLNKDEISILETIDYYFFLEEENKKKIKIEKLLRQFKKDAGLSMQGKLYSCNKKIKQRRNYEKTPNNNINK